MDPIVIPILFIAAVAVAALFFLLWVALKLLLFVVYVLLTPVRWLFGGHRTPPTPTQQVPPQYSRQGTRCGFRNCMALNPPNARFCGRCGSALNVWGGDHYHYPPKSHTRVNQPPQVNYVA